MVPPSLFFIICNKQVLLLNGLMDFFPFEVMLSGIPHIVPTEGDLEHASRLNARPGDA